MKKKIIFTSGGTGGHIFPAINLMKHYSLKGYKVILVTDIKGNNFMKKYSEFQSYVIKAQTITNKSFFKKILSFLLVIYSIFQSIIIIRKEKPDLVFGFGGYASFPISAASKFFKLPLAIYENNIILGRANKFLLATAKIVFVAKKILINFPEKYKNKVCKVGPVLSKEIINYSENITNKKEKKISILVLGGSQGAKIFGEIVPKVINKIKNKGYEIEIFQQCIAEQKNSIIEFYNKNNIKNYIFNFDKQVLKLISSSDLAITRCGASTTAELNHTLTPFIAVPLKNSIDNHQLLNAKYYKDMDCCLILEEENFTEENLFNLIIENIEDKNKLENIRKNMKKNYSKNVYSDIENQIKKII